MKSSENLRLKIYIGNMIILTINFGILYLKSSNFLVNIFL